MTAPDHAVEEPGSGSHERNDRPASRSRCAGLIHLRSSVLLVVAILLTATSSHASTSISVGDEIYSLLSRLEAEGVISDALLSTKPLSRREIVRLTVEAETNAAGRSDLVRGLVRELKRRVRPDAYQAGTVKPVESMYAGYIYTSADVLTLSYPGAAREKEQAFNENNDGDLYNRGSNYRAGLVTRLDDLGPLSVYLNPEYRSDEDVQKGVLRTGYAVLGFSWIDIVAGKDSQWWGPGYHGAILLSNNADPLTMLKLAGPGPQVLPWVFKYLGPFQYNVFVTRLEKDRSDVPEPYLWGMRIDFKPHPNVEIGLQRTAILGGMGRSTDAATWLHSIMGHNEHDQSGNPGDQRAGGDIKITLPFKWQPMQIYWERNGEDNRQRTIGVPYKFADLYGVYLPAVLGLERIDLRAEYAQNAVSGQPYVWYTHSTYTAGYTYDGMVLGHHMGTESRDLFLELSCRLPEQGARFSLSGDREKHNLAGPVSEQTNELSVSGVFLLTKQVEVSVSFGYGRIENPGNAAGSARTVSESSGFIRYLF